MTLFTKTTTVLNIIMHLEKPFEQVAKIDTTLDVYCKFTNSLLAIDWARDPSLHISTDVLYYAPGFQIPDIPWSVQHPGYHKLWGPRYLASIGKDYSQAQIGTVGLVKHLSLAFFEYIETLVANHKVVKAEIIAHPPERVDRSSELQRIHIDRRNLHVHSKRCQLLISGDDQSFLWVEDNFIVTQPDTLIAFDNRRAHWGTNWGDALKLTLIVDLLDLSRWDSMTAIEQQNFFDMAAENDDDLQCEQFREKFKRMHNLS